MKLDLNELKTVECYLGNKEMGKKRGKTIYLLAKYYLGEGYDEAEIISTIDKFMLEACPSYNSVIWSNILESIVKDIIKEDRKLINIESVTIYNEELNYINGLDSSKIQRLAFTYLVYAKIFNQINPKNNNWISGKHRIEVFRDANITETGKAQLLTLHKMLNANVFRMAKGVTNNSLNVDSYIKKEGEVFLILTDFRELGLRYLQSTYNNEIKVSECKCCGRLIVKKENKTMYCKECSKEVKKEQTRKRVEKFRSNQNVTQ